MNTLGIIANAMVSHGNESKFFDWDKAAALIIEHKAIEASAGLKDDWPSTGCLIMEEGLPIDPEGGYLHSTWAIPQIEIGDLIIDCWKWERDCEDWDSKWPESAKQILSLKECS